MYNEKKLLFLKALTPMHVGSGSDLRVVDLPIQREVHTSFPNIQASTLKGCIRDAFEKHGKSDYSDAIFGKEGDKEISAAALALTDARLLFFPVRSAKGVFALITCPMVLKRFQKDLELLGIDIDIKINISIIQSQALVNNNRFLLLDQDGKNKILLDEFKYDAEINDEFQKTCDIIDKMTDSKELLEQHAVLISDDDFTYFVKHATSIVTRIRVGEDGVAENQALFTEEYLPEESILYSLLMMDDSGSEQLMKKLSIFIVDNNIIQIGADKTLGKGFTEMHLKGGEKNG